MANSLVDQGNDETEVAARAQLQSCAYFYNYLTSQEWQLLQSTATVDQKLQAVVARAISIGLCHPNEKTVACVVATVMNGIESQDTKCFQTFFHQRWLRLDSGTCSRLKPVMLRKVRAQTVAEPTVSM